MNLMKKYFLTLALVPLILNPGCVDPDLSSTGGFACTNPPGECPDGYKCNGKICVSQSAKLDSGKADKGKGKLDKGQVKKDAAKPKKDTTKPKVDTAKPKVDTAKPKSDTTKPKSDTTKPKSDTNQPKSDTNQPKPDAKQPAADITLPKADKGNIGLCKWSKLMTSGLPTKKLNAIWSAQSGSAYAVGDGGTVLHLASGK